MSGQKVIEYSQRLLLGAMIVALIPLQFIRPVTANQKNNTSVWETQLVLAESTPNLLTAQKQDTIIEKAPSRYIVEESERKAKEQQRVEVAAKQAAKPTTPASNPVNLGDDEKMSWVIKAAEANHIPVQLLVAVLRVESGMQAYTCKQSGAGATGPAQFMPGTWRHYAADGNGDGRKDICDLRDAAFAAAKLLAANGAAQGNYHQALLHYNHAQWYVNKVLALAGM